MKTNILLVLLSCLSFLSCSSQTERPNKTVITEDDKSELIEPKGSWRVNKEYDADGNIIRFDSIYSWSSSTMTRGLDSDSIVKKMKSLVQKRFSMLPSPSLNGFIENDSIFNQFFSKEFFQDDDFFNDSPFGNQQMDEMMKRMEAMRRQFFNDKRRYIIPPVEDKSNKLQSKTEDKKQV